MSDERVVPLKRREACPICGAPASAKSKPFCSTRCAEVDLGRWLKGSYRVPTDEAPSSDSFAAGEEEGEE